MVASGRTPTKKNPSLAGAGMGGVVRGMSWLTLGDRKSWYLALTQVAETEGLRTGARPEQKVSNSSHGFAG